MYILFEILTICCLYLLLSIFSKVFKIPNILCFIIGGSFSRFLGINHLDINLIGTIGICLLLFQVGLEISLSTIKQFKRFIPSVCFSILFVSIGLAPIFMKFLNIGDWRIIACCALSSTAIIIPMLIDEGELGSKSGQFAVCHSLVSDLLSILIMIFIHSGTGSLKKIAGQLLVNGCLVGVVFILSRTLINKTLQWLIKKNIDLLPAVLFLAIGWGLLLEYFQLSLELGAMLSGLMFAESSFKHDLESYIEQPKNIFLSLFFIYVGCKLDFNFIFHNFGKLLIILPIISLVKLLMPLFCSWISLKKETIHGSIYIFSISEFGFLVVDLLQKKNLISLYGVNFCNTIFITSMMIAVLLPKIPLSPREQVTFLKGDNQVIIFGYNKYSEAMIKIFEQIGVSYLIIDQSLQKIAELRKNGQKAQFGSIFEIEKLKLMKIKNTQLFFLSRVFTEVDLPLLKNIKHEFPLIRFILFTETLRDYHVFKENGFSSHNISTNSILSLMIADVLNFLSIEKIEEIIKIHLE